MTKKVKTIFLGDSGVGKSCIISAICGLPINNIHKPTVGMDFSTKTFKGSSDQYKIQLWDTAGQQKFRSITSSYIRNSKIIILVFDLTCAKTFANLDKWIQMYQQEADEQCKLVLVGNKIDLYHDRKISLEKIQDKIRTNNLGYFQISAKTKEGIDQLMSQIISLLDKMKIPTEGTQQKNPLKDSKKQKTLCCKQS